ncbi:hypothetical protein RJ640_003347 [Escallonia rubra]|uniref:Uncharacterized protein n=1 Tax=Escallonia rubra TaxID=112253 RepID=A0AA88R512_9ASTE|nr:hypothetical protein RJ640_003347 [Escallonia rubra]
MYKDRSRGILPRSSVVNPFDDVDDPGYHVYDSKPISTYFAHAEHVRIGVKHVSHNLSPKGWFGSQEACRHNLDSRGSQKLLLDHTKWLDMMHDWQQRLRVHMQKVKCRREKDSSACVPTHVASMRSLLWAPPPSSLYHCGANGLSGGSRRGISVTSKHIPPKKLCPAMSYIELELNRSHTETSRREDESGASRPKANVWSHSKYMAFLAGSAAASTLGGAGSSVGCGGRSGFTSSAGNGGGGGV